MRGLLDGLRERGFVEGRNLEVHQAHAQAEISNIPQLVQNYDMQQLDLIVPMSTPCLTAAAGMVKNTPVVFTYVYDPIAAGVGVSFTEHLPNVTGVGSFPPVADTIELMQGLIPGLKRIGTLYNSSEANSRKVVEVARSACAERGLRLEEVTIANVSEVFQAAQALSARAVEAIWLGGDNTVIQGFEAVAKVVGDAHIPLVTNDMEPVATHSLATVGIGFYESGHAAATFASRVMRGEKPKDLPIVNVAKRQVTINTVVARKLGLRLAGEVLQQADVVVDDTGAHTKR
jgi:putative ABC transport system substrate-binding protein